MIDIKAISPNELYKIEKEKKLMLPIWASAKTTLYYEDRIIITAWKGTELKGIFNVPVKKENDIIIVDRGLRFFPYASPIIFETDNMKRRKITLLMFKYLVDNYNKISLPLFPNFKDIAPIQSLGIFVECWHTHTLKEKLDINNVTSRLRNHINNALKLIDVVVDEKYDDYNFEKAIKGLKEEIDIRTKSGINLIKNKNGFFVTGIDKNTGRKMGGIMVAYDKDWAYLLHSWRDKDAPRGIIPVLILKGIQISFDEKKVNTFDFEGAVIQNIDIFFSGFNANITTYPYLFWAKDEEEYKKLIKDSISIEGRLI